MVLYFLKHGARFVDVDERLIELAKQELEMIHKVTESDNMDDYPRQESGLCKWSSGQCDFYDVCKGQQKIEDFK
ncbi:unnamed protein product [marine sediment metagenome]|uniref:Uncharacterized protein n=1 Tax=marine sediment metagenome TaxID=412755 RepID=X1MQ20_9ZZZZ